jgi:lipopolysaccharide transport system ATP-binding protein
MGDIALRVEGLGKQYHIGSGKREAYTTLRDTLTDVIMSSVCRAGKLLGGRGIRAADRRETIWALKDISFEINRGEVVGIIGYNGAGKSTLLKILSRITEPTEGYADVYGRVGSLLEVGTGFHPELTGRENIYLNGAILGMRRVEIQRKFDEIVAFAELEKFIDTPVKHYSSGMYMRLAFAVAAHLEPEILLVDEVLAVGDARFQKKCLNKMQDVGQQGRTVLFVSHNMSAITRLCPRAILLDGGHVLQDGPSHQIVSTYLSSEVGTIAVREWPDPAKAPGGEVARLRRVRVCTEDGQTTDVVDVRQPVGIEMEYDVLKSGYMLMPYVHFFNQEGVLAFEASDHDPTWRRRPRPAGRWVSTAWIPGNLLAEGTLLVWPCLFTLDPEVLEISVRDAVAFQIVDSLEGDSARGDWSGRVTAVMMPLLKWTTQCSVNGHLAVTTVDGAAKP